ncbi:MAG: hypothetical protein MJ252_30740 [archaeon]|nr:hypothetical protein [archaeon]
MGCDCGRTVPPADILNQFWADLKIREKELDDVINMINAKKGRAKQISDPKFRQFIEVLVENPNYHEESIKVFIEALMKFREKEEGYFFLAMLFLSKPNSLEAADLEKFITKFCTIWKNQIQAKNTLSETKDTKKKIIKTQNLKDLVFLYVNMISHVGIRFLAGLSEDPNFFNSYFEGPYAEDRLLPFVEENYFKKYTGEDTDVESFFKDNLAHLQDDTWIRNELLKSSL